MTFGDIFAALFPCGSITGAPKMRAMEILRDLEEEARDIYCGAIGYVDPAGPCDFRWRSALPHFSRKVRLYSMQAAESFLIRLPTPNMTNAF